MRNGAECRLILSRRGRMFYYSTNCQRVTYHRFTDTLIPDKMLYFQNEAVNGNQTLHRDLYFIYVIRMALYDQQFRF